MIILLGFFFALFICFFFIFFWIVKALWKNPSKYKRRLVVEEQGESHFRIKFDKSEEDVLNLIRADFNLDENNKPVQSKVSTLFKYMKQIFSKKGKKIC